MGGTTADETVGIVQTREQPRDLRRIATARRATDELAQPRAMGIARAIEARDRSHGRDVEHALERTEDRRRIVGIGERHVDCIFVVFGRFGVEFHFKHGAGRVGAQIDRRRFDRPVPPRCLFEFLVADLQRTRIADVAAQRSFGIEIDGLFRILIVKIDDRR